jgi:ATP-binding cassette subfamily B protein/subfamily B ATP-binding cassette protein MsbA
LREVCWSNLRQVKGRLALAALFTLGLTATDLLKAWPLKIILDYGILNEPLPNSLRFLEEIGAGGGVPLLVAASFSIVLFALAGGLFAYLQIYITSSVGYRIVYALRRELFAHLQRLSLSFHNRARSGDLLTRIASDTNILKDLLGEAILKLLSHVLLVVGMFAVMFAVSWKITLITLATLPFLGYSLFHVYRRTNVSAKLQKKQEGRAASRMSEVLSAIPLVQAFSREKYEEEQYDAVAAQSLREGVRIARLHAAAARASEIITTVGMAAAVFVGGRQVLDGRMMPGDLVLIVSYLSSMYSPMRKLAKLSTDFSKGAASAARLSEVLDIEPDIQDRPDAIEAAHVKGQIEFRNVSFDYGDGHDVLRQVSFTVSPGQRLALVGVSGTGKSTIASLILRLYEPQDGTILIDRVDIQHYRRESLRRQIGIVLQQSILFGAPIRENIAYGRPEASLEEIVAAAKAANADEFIRELENGYDTVIAERGATLSGGQRQRIAIARALIREAPILILDEPMTGLDVESEAKVREALDRLMAGKTCLMITHDLPSIADADLVLVLEDGRIIDRGTHAELMATSARYRELCELDASQPAAALPGARSDSRPARKRELPAAVRSEAFPADAEFPQLKIASDPARMLEVFRAHLEPASGRVCEIQDCVPVRFRCRQSTSRCVLQYVLRLLDPRTGRRWDQWVTGLLYAQDGEAERLWREARAGDPRREIPESWLPFEPVEFIPDLQMLVQVFPYDRKLQHLRLVMGGAIRGLEPQLLARLEPGRWHPGQRTIEPMRYRTELGAVLRYTLDAREVPTARSETIRCYLKVYRNQRGEDSFRLLRSLWESAGNGQKTYSVVEPIAYSVPLRTLVLKEARGTSLQQALLGRMDPIRAVRAVARAVAAFNQEDLRVTRRHSLADQLDDVRRASSLLEWACPRARSEIRAITDAVGAGLEEVRPVPIHRDLKPDHIFLEGDHVTFIDLDSVVLGDPVRDPAHLFAHIVGRVGLDSMTSQQARAASTAFVEEYFAHVPNPWRERFPLHCAGALIEVAAGIFKRQEPRWREKVEAAIEAAEQAMSKARRALVHPE